MKSTETEVDTVALAMAMLIQVCSTLSRKYNRGGVTAFKCVANSRDERGKLHWARDGV
jgi:hypothetical protein